MNGMNNMWIVSSLLILAASLQTVLCGSHPDGASKVSREQDALGNYKFSYSVSNIEGEHFREEGTDHLGRVVGSYGLKHNDGTHRVVDYVADKDGFRAEIRSNEPGVASSDSADASIAKLQPDLPLAVAATSIDDSRKVFGTRLRTDSSRVAYANQEEGKSPGKEQLDNSARESRQRELDDYRPHNPVAYYPDSRINSARPLSPPSYASADNTARLRPLNPSIESRPLDVYLPPINPHTAARRPSYLVPGDRATDRSLYTTTSRRPFIPPYGGFDDDDDDPVPINRRPGISMSTIHGGLGTEDFKPPQTSTPGYGAGRYPSDDFSHSRDFIRPRFPPSSNTPNFPRLPGSFLPDGPRNVPPGSFFGPPSYDTPRRPSNFVLRAVPIQNGIQAVRVDPETGRVYERLMYPLYLSQDGHTEYDRNILLHNDDVSDDNAFRNDNPSYLDIPFRRRPPFRSVRNPPFNSDGDFANRTRHFNRSFIDPLTLSIPTDRDLSWVQRQLSMVEGFDRTRIPNSSHFRSSNFANSEYPSFNDFDYSPAEESPNSEDSSYSRNRNSDRAIDNGFFRNTRLFDRLTPEDTKEIVMSNTDSELDARPAETNPEPSVAEKE